MKNNNKGKSIGVIAVITAGVAAVCTAAVAFKVRDDIKKSSKETNLISPDESMKVNVVYGASKGAKKVFTANVTAIKDTMKCSLRVVSMKEISAPVSVWENEHTLILTFVDTNNGEQSVIVNFLEDKIEMYHEK